MSEETPKTNYLQEKPTYYVKDSNNTDVPSNAPVKLYLFRGYAEATVFTRRRNKSTLKIKEKYHKPRTVKSKVRADNVRSMKRSQKRLTLLLFHNFLNTAFVYQAVLTYAKKEFDINNVYKDFSKFREKFRYRFSNVAYVAIYEFHEDKSLHIHLIFKNVKGVSRESLEKLWGNGFVFLRNFNTSAIPYFCKKERIGLYPVGSRLYSKSRNVKVPTPMETNVKNLQHITKDMKCVSKVAKKLYIKSGQEEEKEINRFVYMKFKKEDKGGENYDKRA